MTIVKPNVTDLTQLFKGAHNRLLDVVDMQFDFMDPKGKLAVAGADAVIGRANHFFNSIPNRFFNFGLLKFDTHFTDEYARSPESKQFNPHCIYGTDGWGLAVDTTLLFAKMRMYAMIKNEFDMWGSNPTGVAKQDITFHNYEHVAYQNLFQAVPIDSADDITRKLETPMAGIDRDRFMDENDVGPGTVVTLMGVASDFCDTQALIGYLRRGATVVIANDLVCGIGGEFSPAPKTGTFEEVIENLSKGQCTEFAPPRAAEAIQIGLAQGRLVLASSDDIVAAMDATVRPKPLFNLDWLTPKRRGQK